MIPTVLFYHQILKQPRPEHYFLRSATTIDQFRSAMTTVKQQWHPLSIEEFAWIQKNGGRWPKNSVLITFDDGFKNSLWAAEVLRELEMSAVFFVISGVVGTRFQPWYVRFAHLLTSRQRDSWECSWGAVDFRNQVSRRRWLKRTKEHLLSVRAAERDAALEELAQAVGASSHHAGDADLEFFDAGDLRQLQALGMTVGGHSRTHDNLAACSPTELQAEIVDSSDELGHYAGAPIRYFSYPDGRFNASTVRIARQRFDAAFTTETRYTAPDPWRFPRREADGVDDVRRVLSLRFPAKRRAINAAKRILRF